MQLRNQPKGLCSTLPRPRITRCSVSRGLPYASEMKAIVSLRQALDWPELPPPPPTVPDSLPPGRQLASRRHLQGRQHLSAVLNYWLARSGLSHEQLGSIADWAMSEKGWLSSPQLSHLRNGSVVKPSHRNLDALGGANEALWLWQRRGPEVCMRRYGPHSAYRIQDEWLTDAIWLHHPDHQDEALNYADFCDLQAGYLVLPYLGEVNLSPSEAKALSQALADLFDSLTQERMTEGRSMREALDAVLSAYPSSASRDRRDHLRGVILGTADYTKAELEKELFMLAETVRHLRQLPEGGYGPAELHAELSSSRRRA